MKTGTYLVLIKLSLTISTTVSYGTIGMYERERESVRVFVCVMIGRTLDALLSYSVQRPDLIPSTGYLRQVP